MFFRSVASAILIIAISTASAHAQLMLDVSKITCQQYFTAKVSHPQTIGIWLNGYYNGKRNNTLVDIEGVKGNVDKVRRYCQNNLKSTVMEAVEKVLEEKR